MAKYAEYFAARDAELPKPKYHSGNRVFGHWNQIPFIGSVVREQNKNVLVHSDLPIKHQDVVHNIVKVTRDQITLLKNHD